MQNNTQLTHRDHRPANSKFPLTVVVSDLSSPLNVGSLFRLCDAVGVEKLYLCGKTAAPPNTKITKTSRSTEKYVDYEVQPHADSVVSKLKDSGSFIVSLEITTSSISINAADFKSAIQNKKPICLILGAENTGVAESLLSLSDLTVHIPMYGNNSSMNVISAASIACFEIIREIKR